MKKHLAPKYNRTFGDLVLCWFQNSNSYTLFSSKVFNLIDTYIKSANEHSFLVNLETKYGITQDAGTLYYKEIIEFLQNQNQIEKDEIYNNSNIDLTALSTINIVYSINNCLVKIRYQSQKIMNLIHPLIDHLTTQRKDINFHEIFVLHKDKRLFLFHSKELFYSCEDKDYHKLQGKFSLLLTSIIYNTKETDYLACFHASTMANSKNTLMLIGSSGSGKSTLSALLQTRGYSLVSDDTTYIQKDDLKVISYPAGISIKEGAFKVLKSFYPNIDLLKKYIINPKKKVVYIAPSNSFDNKKFSCQTIILVQYKEDTETKVESIKIDEVLKILIPESWISPEPESALQFFTWIERLNCYKLTYSEFDDVPELLDAL